MCHAIHSTLPGPTVQNVAVLSKGSDGEVMQIVVCSNLIYICGMLDVIPPITG